MDISNLRKKLTGVGGGFLFAVMALQPPLDVLSYFMNEYGSTLITTALRAVLLFAVFVYGFIVETERRRYLIFGGVIAGFWLLHTLNCFRLGYQDPLGDLGEYLKLVQFPLWTLVFTTLLQSCDGLESHISGALAVNFCTVLLVIGLSYLTGSPVYTYDSPSRGVKMGLLGWFSNHNGQSAIVCMLVIGLLLWAYHTRRVWIFTLASALGFTLLYFTGTRLAYYSAMLTALGLCFFVLISGGRMRLCCIPLAAALVLLVLFKGVSIMETRQTLTGESFQICQEPTDEIMGEYKDYVYDSGEIPPEIEERITRVYEDVYGGLSFAGGTLLGDLLDRFGTERVMKAYNYTTKATTLYDGRTKKLKAMELLWEEQDAPTRLLGFERSNVAIGPNLYGPENDISALPYYYGYMGFALFIGFIGYIFLPIAISCVKNLQGLGSLLTVDFGAWLMLLVLGLGAGQLSGNVLQNPSASVYLSLAAAELCHITKAYGSGRLRARYERRQGLTIIQSPVIKGGG